MVSGFRFSGRTNAGSAFDGERNLLKIKTFSDDTHLFNIATGQTIATLHGAARVAGRLYWDDGSSKNVDNIRVCWSDTFLIGTQPGPEAGSAVDAVGLGAIERMERVKAGDGNQLRFRFILRGGGERHLAFQNPPPSLCGKVADGRALTVLLDEVAALEVAPVPSP